MTVKSLLLATCSVGLIASINPAFASSFFTDEAAFTAAAPGGTEESFEDATLLDPTTVGFAAGTFSCAGDAFCPGFFGISSAASITGNLSVFAASPDSVTFSFDTAISSFGIFIGGAGDVAPITLTMSTSAGDAEDVLTDYSNDNNFFEGNTVFAGVVDANGFTSVTFTPSNEGDGLFFDAMTTSPVAAVPLPAGLPLLLGALGVFGLVRRRAA